MSGVDLQGLLQLIAADDGTSLPRAARKLRLGQSQLLRALTALGGHGAAGAAALIEVRGDSPQRLYLTPAGRAHLERDDET
ncbi:hypothetical protein [Solimonas terrae]|uniref:LysR family transcriptional regulator n=1 Tax=Solimonas terrae TaxID=1396819 RepID=A0A6M2BPK6_9GAMM|nr:hypothetical protein [Solimonas terrae]NGY04125.1 hypothetical protein [Solimonas terrae]